MSRVLRFEGSALYGFLIVTLLVVVHPLRAQTVTTTIPVGTGDHAVAVNPVTNKIYVANGGSNNVTVIDGATNTPTTVSAGAYPIAA